MIVNPFSYLIEKLKSKADKSEIPDEKSVKNYYDSRPNSANVKFGDGRLRQFKATGQMTTGKPMDDGHIIHLAWDASGDGDAELYIPNGTSGKMQYRVQNGGTWQNWSTVALTSDILNSDTYTGNSDGYNGVNTNIKLTDRIIISAVLDGYTVVPGKNGNVWRFQIGGATAFPSYPSNTSTTITYWYLKV